MQAKLDGHTIEVPRGDVRRACRSQYLVSEWFSPTVLKVSGLPAAERLEEDNNAGCILLSRVVGGLL